MRGVGQLLLCHGAQRFELGRLPVAKRNRSGLVEQQRVDVARCFYRAPRHRQHVEADQAIHACDTDRRQQRADGGGNEGHEQRDQNDDRDRAAGIGCIARNGDGREDEDDGQSDEQDVERDLVWRLLALGALDQLDHAIEKGRAGRRRDAHANPIGEHLRAAGDRRAVTAQFTDDRSQLARDGGLVDRGYALDDLAVRRNGVAGLNQNHVADLQTGARDQLEVLPVGTAQKFGLRFRPCLAQRSRLRLAAPFGDGFGEVGKQHREPQP